MVSTVAADLIAQIADRYAFRGDGVPEALAEAGPEVAALLLEAADHIAAYFGPAPRLVLEFFVFLDDDDDDEPGKLYALIQTRLKPEQARPLMDRLRHDWWLLAYPRANGRLNIAPEYV